MSPPGRCVRLLPRFLLGLACTTGQAQQPRLTLSQYHHTAWTTRSNAPAGVYALAQTADGYLWLGTTGGLFRFDGVRFELVEHVGNQQIPSSNIASLLAVGDALWIGYRLGGVSVLQGDSLRSYGTGDGLPERSVWTMARDSSGTMWAGTTAGLFKLVGAHWEAIGPDRGIPRVWVISLLIDRRGRLWAATLDGVFRLEPGSARFALVHPAPPSVSDVDKIDAFLTEAPDGAIWLSSWLDGLVRLDGPGGLAKSERLHPPPTGALHIDSDGDFWVAVRGGVRRIWSGSAGRRQPPAESQFLGAAGGLSGTEINTVLRDREGNLWLGTAGGIDRFRRSKVMKVLLPPLAPSFALAPGDSGTVWVGSVQQSMMKARGEVVEETGGPRGTGVVYRDRDGVIWAGTRKGLWRTAGRGFVRVSVPAEVFGSEQQAITQDASGALWISVSRRGVYRLAGNEWTKFGGHPELPQEPAIVLTTDEAGRTWFGYTGSRIALLEGQRVRLFTPADGLDVGNVLAIYGQRGHVWVGGERGLARFDGTRFQAVVGRGGVRYRGTSGIVETADGELWLHGAPGITRIHADEVRRVVAEPEHQVMSEHLDHYDGLDGAAEQLRPLPTAIEASDGKIWFATSTGVYQIDPRAIPRNDKPPLVDIRALAANGRSYGLGTRLTLPARTTALQIDFAALGLSIPERIRYRYRLIGNDTSWQDVGARRQAFYTNLGPGSYRFRVIAANEDGVWNTSGATIGFTIPPSFTQSRWFLALWVCGIGVVIWLLYRLRVRQVAGRLRTRYQVALAERTRIAQDLHDTLLQGFTGVSLQVVAATSKVGGPPEAIRALRDVVALAQQTLVDARQAIWDIRSADLQKQSLAEALDLAAHSAVGDSGVRVGLEITGPAGRIDPELETTALRVGREAILNALKHAAPSHIDLILEYTPHQFTLRVIDDGRGMPPGAADAARVDGHWGVAGMRERARRVGGTLDIAGGPGRGTIVSLHLPRDRVVTSGQTPE